MHKRVILERELRSFILFQDEAEFGDHKQDALLLCNTEEGKTTMTDQQPRSTAKSHTEEGLPLEDYDSLSADAIVHKLPTLTARQVEKLCRYEKAHKKRRKLLRYLEGRIGSNAATGSGGREDPPPGEERPQKRRQTEIGTIGREDPAPGEERPERRRL